MSPDYDFQVAIIGAGPYGLAAAAHLRAAGVETCVFGEAMQFWNEQMPKGMFLRSSWDASHISDPTRGLSLDAFQGTEVTPLSRPIALDRFVDYGRWFQKQAVPDLDPRRVSRVEQAGRGFRLELADGSTVLAERVVVATGISLFAWRPPQFAALPPALASHAVEHRDLSRFAGQRVAVVGGGQSALESAALLHEAGAAVEVIARQPAIRWLDQKARWLKSPSNPFRSLLYPSTDVGPPILNQIVAAPDLFRRLPRAIADRVAYRSIRPAGAAWLVSRLATVPIATSRSVVTAARHGEEVELTLDDATRRTVDHVFLSTGYRVDIARYGFLPPELVAGLRRDGGYPLLTAGLESSIAGLHFLGAPAAISFGPLCRFVAGTKFTARALTRRIVGARAFERRGFAESEAPARPVEAEISAP